jgi:quercetin dioxygenase-like cupin family protein
MPIEIRKLADVPDERRGWLVGHFLPEGDAFRDENVEFYYKTFKKGDPADKAHFHPQGRDYLIVLEGSARLRFDGEDVILKKGDYAVLPANTREEVIEVIEDFTVVGVRYPSIPNNKVFL